MAFGSREVSGRTAIQGKNRNSNSYVEPGDWVQAAFGSLDVPKLALVTGEIVVKPGIVQDPERWRGSVLPLQWSRCFERHPPMQAITERIWLALCELPGDKQIVCYGRFTLYHMRNERREYRVIFHVVDLMQLGLEDRPVDFRQKARLMVKLAGLQRLPQFLHLVVCGVEHDHVRVKLRVVRSRCFVTKSSSNQVARDAVCVGAGLSYTGAGQLFGHQHGVGDGFVMSGGYAGFACDLGNDCYGLWC